MILKLCKLLLIIIFFNSCDILRFSQFEVTSWRPGEGYHSEPEEIVVSLNFSHDPDKDSVERRFSLTGDNGRVKGVFLWKGKKMTFAPLTPLEKNTDYNLSLTAEARDTRGLSMDTAFERHFTTRPGIDRPALISCYPSMYAEIGDSRMEVQLEFSTPVQLNTLYDNVSFSPSITGSWRLENGEKSASFTPAEPWALNTRYEIRVSSSLTDNNGMNIRNDFTSVFSIGTDHEAPELLYACRITQNGGIIPLELDTGGYVSASGLPIESQDWEKEDRLSLVFSEPVDSLSVKNCLSVENASSFVMQTSPGYETEFIFRFETIPVYESRFTFRLKPGVRDSAGNDSKKEYIYRIFANGKYSKPPTLAGIRLPMAPKSGTNQELVHFGTDSLFEIIPIKDDQDNYPSGENVETWIELYFITAEGSSIDPFSLMELFRIETSNNVLTFSPRQVKTNNFSTQAPQAGWENLERLEITGNLANSTNYGVVNFQISSGLKDSFGNKNDKTLRISLIK